MRRQFDVYENPDAASRSFAPGLVVLSSHHADLQAATVAPLLNDRSRAARTLEITVTFEGAELVLSMTDLFSVDAAQLHRRLGDLARYEDDIRRGLDRLFNGF